MNPAPPVTSTDVGEKDMRKAKREIERSPYADAQEVILRKDNAQRLSREPCKVQLVQCSI